MSSSSTELLYMHKLQANMVIMVVVIKRLTDVMCNAPGLLRR